MNRQHVRGIAGWRRSRSIRAGAALLLAGVLAACGSQGATPTAASGSGSSAAPAQSFTFDPKLVADAQKAALDAAGGKSDLGGTVDFVWGTGGAENDRLKALLQPFTDATGVAVNVESVSNSGQVIQTRLQAGNPPDVALDTSLGAVQEYYRTGKLVPLDGFIDKSSFAQAFGQGQADAVTIDGKLYAIPGAAQGVEVWYNKKLYKGPTENVSYPQLVQWGQDELKAGHPAPFCINLEQAAASANNAFVQIDNIMAQEYGADFIHKLGTGDIKYDSDQVKTAFKNYIDMFSNGLVYGGANAALTTPIKDAPLNLFTDPQNCQLVMWGPFTPGIITAANPNLKPGQDFDYFQLVPSNAGQPSSFYTWGWETFAFSDSPQTQAFMKYWASKEFQSLVASTGAYVMANQQVDLGVYPNDTIRGIAQDQRQSDVVIGPYGLEPSSVRNVVLSAIMTSVADPSQLDGELEKIDQAYQTFLDGGN